MCESDYTRLQAWLIDLPHIPVPSMPRTPSPTKRRKLDDVQDETPRATSSTGGRTDDSADPFFSRSNESQSYRVQRSSRSSPTKHDFAMRFARNLPVLRLPIDDAPQHIQQLGGRLIGLKDKLGVLPVKLKDAIQAYHSLREPIKDYMFTSERTDADTNTDDDTNADDDGPDNGGLERLDRLVEIRDNTRQCKRQGRNFHEVEWNETVHSPMLRLVTRGRQDLACRNLTQANISKRWTDPATQDNRIDYGIFVVPARHSDLYNRIDTYVQEHPGSQVNPLEDIDSDYPLAIIIETKRLAPGVEKADMQLANFARCFMRLTGEFTFAKDPQLVLPLLKVVGSDWEVEFMVREKNRATIYEGDIALGSTSRLTDCYRLYKSLTILFTWTGRQSTDWWSSALSSPPPAQH